MAIAFCNRGIVLKVQAEIALVKVNDKIISIFTNEQNTIWRKSEEEAKAVLKKALIQDQQYYKHRLKTINEALQVL
jgi:hypothetical protein